RIEQRLHRLVATLVSNFADGCRKGACRKQQQKYRQQQDSHQSRSCHYPPTFRSLGLHPEWSEARSNERKTYATPTVPCNALAALSGFWLPTARCQTCSRTRTSVSPLRS